MRRPDAFHDSKAYIAATWQTTHDSPVGHAVIMAFPLPTILGPPLPTRHCLPCRYGFPAPTLQQATAGAAQHAPTTRHSHLTAEAPVPGSLHQ